MESDVCVRSGNRGVAAHVGATGVVTHGPDRQKASRSLVDFDVVITDRITVRVAAIVDPRQRACPCVSARLRELEVDQTATAQKHPTRQRSALIVPSRRLRIIVIRPDQQAAARALSDPDQGQFDPIGHGSGLRRILRQDRQRGLQ